MSFAVVPEDPNPIGGGRKPQMIAVEIDPSFGLSAKFKCLSAEVISAVPCGEDGNVSDGEIGKRA
jgi:hypothetical protein